MSDEAKVPLTQQAFDRLKEELDYLEGEGRAKVIDEIAVARAHGDLSENAEYHAAKDQQGLQEARVRQVRQMLENAEIITGDDDAIVKPGKLVTIRHQGEDEAETYLIGLREERGEHEVLTPDSPLGRVLLGRSAGETVEAAAPRGGRLHVDIVEVRPL